MQSTVNYNLGFGVIGEFYDDSPRRVQPGVLHSADASYNVIGRVVTYTSLGSADGTAPAIVAAGGAAASFAGILVGPKEQALVGTTAGTLTPTLTLPQDTTVQFAAMGSVIVALDAAADETTALKYNTTTGVILTGAPGAGEAALPNAKVVRYESAAAGLAVIQLTN